jgi:hypothetical protein
MVKTGRLGFLLAPALVGAMLAAGLTSAPPARAAALAIYVSPSGNDANPGTSSSEPVRTLQRAQQLVREMNSDLSGNLTVVLAGGYYRLSSPLTLTAADSGSGGYNVVWTAAPGARPVITGSVQITGWSKVAGSSDIYWAQGPAGIRTRQLYVDGTRAQRASGPLPVTLTKTADGYTASAATMSAWRDPSGQSPPEVEFVYPGGLGAWTEPRCPVASMSGTTITMAEPCWDDSNDRGSNNVGPGSLSGPPSLVENAYQLLTKPGQWYLDTGSSRFYYIPEPGQDMADVDVEAPVLQSLITGGGTASSPLHNVVFSGIQFSYATWLGPSTGAGFSEVQANYLNQGPTPTADNAGYDWTQIPANVSLTYDQHVQFTGDAFVHLGAAGLGLGDGSQYDLIQGDVVTDTSGNGIELGNVDMPEATGSNQTVGNTIDDNYVFGTSAEYQGGIGIDVGYAADTQISDNQIDDVPYSGISIGWGGWPDKTGKPGLANFSHGNVVSDNLIFNIVTVLGDGAAIYSNGQTGSSFATGEHITGNVLHNMDNIYHMINTDNGTDWMTVTGNASWNTGPSNSWGYCHTDYYPGEGGGLDHENVTGNYWDNSSGNGSHGQLPTHTGNCYVQDNTDITSGSQVPASILDDAGLPPAYQSLLSWTQVPPPPAG